MIGPIVLHGLALVRRVGDVGVPVEAVVEGLAHVHVAEEVRRDAVAVQLAAADVGVAALNVDDIEDEEGVGAGGAGGVPVQLQRGASGFSVASQSYSPSPSKSQISPTIGSIWARFSAGTLDPVGVAGLHHGEAGAPLINAQAARHARASAGRRAALEQRLGAASNSRWQPERSLRRGSSDPACKGRCRWRWSRSGVVSEVMP